MYEVTNNAFWYLLSPISAVGTEIEIQNGRDGVLPLTYPYLLTLEQVVADAVVKREIVRVTGKIWAKLQIERAYAPCPLNDTSMSQQQAAQSFNAWDYVGLRIVASILDMFVTHDELTAVVHLTGAESIAGVKTFSDFPVTPSSAPTTDYQTANKKYVDDVDSWRYDLSTSWTSKTVNRANGRRQYISMTGNCTFTFSNPVAGRTYLLELIQDWTGGRTVTRPWSVEGTVSIDSAINAKTIVTMYYDWTKYHLLEWWGGGGWSTWWSFKFALAWTIWATGTNVANTVMATWTKTITSCHLWYGTAGNGTLTIDVNKNGTSIFSTNPTITTTNQKTVNAGTISSGGVVAWDMLTLDIDWVPWTTKWVDLFVELVYS